MNDCSQALLVVVVQKQHSVTFAQNAYIPAKTDRNLLFMHTIRKIIAWASILGQPQLSSSGDMIDCSQALLVVVVQKQHPATFT